MLFLKRFNFYLNYLLILFKQNILDYKIMWNDLLTNFYNMFHNVLIFRYVMYKLTFLYVFYIFLDFYIFIYLLIVKNIRRIW